jgi:hypothetical protein
MYRKKSILQFCTFSPAARQTYQRTGWRRDLLNGRYAISAPVQTDLTLALCWPPGSPRPTSRFLGDEQCEVGWRDGQGYAAEVSKPRLYSGVGKSSGYLLV